MKKVIVSLVLGLGVLANANAQGDAEAGKAKAATCAACHGATGHSAVDTYPNLAGQHADYIVKQLKAFKDGSTRNDPVMAPMAAALSEQDMQDVAAYYASQPRVAGGESADGGSAPAAAAPVAIVGDAAAGKYLYENGDEARAIGACIGCHGAKGNSDVLIYPNLAKQHPEYIEKQLKNFKNGDRQNAAMNNFAEPLTEQEIADLGAYFKDPDSVADIVAVKTKATVKVAGDVEAGKALSATCAACHGADGNAMVTMYPKLAGQHEGYLLKQLQEFKSGARDNAVMAPMVAALSEDDMKNLAAYFASQTTAKLPAADSVNNAGKAIFFGGIPAKGVTACAACHSPSGQGMANARFPSLVNQHPDYVKSQLEQFRSAGRANDMNGMMRDVAVKLSDKEIADVAAFIATLK
ncbi:c-type cytochrome [Colwellia sp. MEBiC06753]